MSTSCYAGSASTTGTLLFSTSDSSATHIALDQKAISSRSYTRRKRQKEKKIDNAVYGYIQAIRALGRTTVSSYQISSALDLPYMEVTLSIERLREQGIRINKIC